MHDQIQTVHLQNMDVRQMAGEAKFQIEIMAGDDATSVEMRNLSFIKTAAQAYVDYRFGLTDDTTLFAHYDALRHTPDARPVNGIVGDRLKDLLIEKAEKLADGIIEQLVPSTVERKKMQR